MMPSTEEYDRIERAVTRGQRLVIQRRGTEYIVIPLRLTSRGGREMIEARNPTTGDRLELFIDELDRVEVVG
jgi:predicted DNA-binding transcriptional regulator YafY